MSTSKSITKKSDEWSSQEGQTASGIINELWSDGERHFRRWMLEPTNSGVIQFFRYGFVGGIAFLFDIATLWLVTSKLGIHYLVGGLLGFCVGLIVNYGLSVFWVFDRRQVSSRSMQFGMFALIGVVGVGVNELIMWLLTEKIGWHYLGSKLAATVFVYVWNFAARKTLLF